MTKASPAEPIMPLPTGTPPGAGPLRPGGSRSLWLWVGGAFCLLLLAWTFLFTVARSAKIVPVPSATKGGGAR